jgi:mRNA-degrading endonuclease HigB of HigAB toxin-antitoxin module
LNILSVNKLHDAQSKYPSAIKQLQGWYQVVKQTDFVSADALRETFGDMRGFRSSFKFPIPVSSLLAYTTINFDAKVLIIEEIKPGNH